MVNHGLSPTGFNMCSSWVQHRGGHFSACGVHRLSAPHSQADASTTALNCPLGRLLHHLAQQQEMDTGTAKHLLSAQNRILCREVFRSPGRRPTLCVGVVVRGERTCRHRNTSTFGGRRMPSPEFKKHGNRFVGTRLIVS